MKKENSYFILLKVPQDHKYYVSSSTVLNSRVYLALESRCVSLQTHTSVDYIDFDDLKNHPKYFGKIEQCLRKFKTLKTYIFN